MKGIEMLIDTEARCAKCWWTPDVTHDLHFAGRAVPAYFR
jgi:hypothetical protein